MKLLVNSRDNSKKKINIKFSTKSIYIYYTKIDYLLSYNQFK